MSIDVPDRGTPVDNWRDIGWAIRVERQSKRLRQEDLASMAQVSRGWLNRLEGGQLENPAGAELLRVLDALELQMTVRRRPTG